MFSSKNIQVEQLTTQFILNHLSEIQIFQYYIPNFKELNKSFLSDLYNDTSPGVVIFQKANNRLCYKDHGTGDSFDVFSYIMRKFNVSLVESINIIANDFGLRAIRSDLRPQFLIGRENIPKEENKPSKAIISIVPRGLNYSDYCYWTMRYSIPLSMLEEYDIFPSSCVYLNKGDKTTVIQEERGNPIYSYRFTNNEGLYVYKVYKPLAEKRWKWLYNGSKDEIEGFAQLPLHGNILLITKSLKDVLVLKVLGYDAISLQGETNKLEKNVVSALQNRFENIILLYDNDEEGIKGAKRISNSYGFKSIILPFEKDISDLINIKRLKETQLIIDKLINDNK